MTPTLHRRAVDRLPVPPAAERRRWAEHPEPSPAAHRTAVDALAVFDAVEVREVDAPPRRTGPVRVVAFNLERGRHLEGCAELLTAADADVVLLSEVDRGMARSGQADVASALAERLGMTCVFAVEFVELGAGSPEEAAQVGADPNDAGLHGSAVLTRLPVLDAAVVRLELDGAWYGPRPSGLPIEPRIGGRIAVLTVVDTGPGELVVASPHLESHGHPRERAAQLGAVLDALEELRPAAPAVVGGDLNTTTLGPEHFADPQRLDRALRDGAERFLRPRAWEPLFASAERAGYTWQGLGDAAATARVSRDLPPTMALDWFLTRAVDVAAARVVPAVADDGSVVSDHEAIVLDGVVVRG